MSIEKFQPSYDIYPERIEKLRTVFPEVFADGKISWDVLKESVGSFIEDEDAEKEHYAFTWPGKREARRMAGKPPQGTLVPAIGEGINDDSAENIYIDGDNLEVLKLLQKSYAGKVKMIYIDPPYNTGSDFIYSDNFTQPLDEYLKCTGQLDEQGNPLVSNKKADGRFHSKWLNMMYPRLSLACNLLKDDGIIFISIDDNEVDNLKKLCNEIFGEENFIANFLWKKKSTTSNVEGSQVSPLMDYTLCYGKSENAFIKQRVKPKEERVYPLSDEEGSYRLTIIEKKDSGAYKRDSMKFNIIGYPPREGKRWQIGEETARILEARKRFVYVDGAIKLKIYDFEDKDTYSAQPNILDNHGSTDSAAKYVNDELFGISELFNNPKPVELIQHLVSIASSDGDIVLDFFSGSGTTGDAVLRLNLQNKESRKFILTQLPELCDEGSEASKAGFKTIADIGKERMRRVIKKLEGKEGAINNKEFGFKVFKLQKSHFNEWRDYKGSDVKELMDLFTKQEDALVPDWKRENLIFEIMLQEGFPLHSKIMAFGSIKDNCVLQVQSEFCQHTIYVCLDEKIDLATVEQLPLSDKNIFICLDSALTDRQKVALSDRGVIKTI